MPGWCGAALRGGRRSGEAVVTGSLPARAGRRPVLRHGFELVADAVARLDERVPRCAAVDLLAQAAHEDVDRPVAMRLAASPELLEQLVPGGDAAAVERELVEKAELGRGQAGGLAVDERLDLARVDHELLDLDRLAARRFVSPRPAPRRSADACDEFLHREGLDEVVVGADLERVHAIVLRAACRYHDDRSADPLGANRLDQLP